MTKVEPERRTDGEPPTDLAAERLRAKLRAKMFQVRDTGARVGRFTITEKLGCGGMGEVFAAQEDGSGRRVAVKVLHSAIDDMHDGGDGGAARLQREAKALARVDHPNVVGLLDVGTDNGRVYLAMELVDGPTIEEWVAEASPDWTTIVDKFAQAARGLGAAHAAGLVHRDVKPANLLIGADGCVKVLDFGLARRLDAGGLAVDESQWSETLTRPGDLMGTPSYMSPEHASSGVITASSDQFGLCVALYEALFGMRPHAGDTIPQLLQAIAKGERRRPPRNAVPPHVRDALERGLQTDPERRFTSMEALADALSAAPKGAHRWVAIGVVAAAAMFAVGWWASPSAAGPAQGDPVPLLQDVRPYAGGALGHGATVRMWQRAEQELNAALEQRTDGDAGAERIQVARAALSLGRFNRAEEVLRPLLDERAPPPSALVAAVWVVGALEHDVASVERAVAKVTATTLSPQRAASLELARGEALVRCGQLSAAASAFAGMAEVWSSTLPPEDARTAWARALAAATAAHAGQAEFSVVVFREALAVLRPSLGNEHPRVGRTQLWLAEALAQTGDPVGARSLYVETIAALRELGADGPQWWADAATSAAAFELDQGEPARAKAYLDAVLREAEREGASFERWKLYRLRGRAELALGDEDDAGASFERAHDALAPFASSLGTEVLLLALARAGLPGGDDDPGALQTRLALSRSSAAPHARVAVASAVAAQWSAADQPGAAIAVLRGEIMALGVGAASATSRVRLLLALARVYESRASTGARVSVLKEARALLRRHPGAARGRAMLLAEVKSQLGASRSGTQADGL